MKKIEEYRREKHLTQQELGKMCGCGLNLISRLENGVTLYENLKPDLQERIAKVIGVPVQSLYRQTTVREQTCKTYTMPRDELEKMLKEKYGDKIGKPRGKIGEVKSRSQTEVDLDELNATHWDRVRSF